MAICSFLGNETVYEENLSLRLIRAVENVVVQNDEIEFLFYEQGSFYVRCLAAVMEVTHQYPYKHFTYTLLQAPNDDKLPCDFPRSLSCRQIPKSIIGKVVVAPVDTKNDPSSINRHKKSLRWMIGQSQFVISYIYPDFQDSLYPMYKFVMRQKGITTFNIISKETEKFIKKSIRGLSDKERLFIQKREEGYSYRKMGPIFKMSESAVRTQTINARIQLQKFALERQKILFQEQAPARPIVCSIMEYHRDTDFNPNVMEEFRATVDFLIHKFKVSLFLIEQSYCTMPFAKTIYEIVCRNPSIKVRLITHYPAPSSLPFCEIMNHKFPFDEIQNIDPHAKTVRAKILRTLKAMIDQSDFLINHSMESPIPNNINKYLIKSKHVKVIDIGDLKTKS